MKKGKKRESHRLFWFCKRSFDIFGSIFLFVIFSPILLTISLSIKHSSPGPVLYVKKRSGMYGKLFVIYKFRSMVDKAYDILRYDPKLKKAFEEQQKGGNYKIKEDPRVTPIGKFIRKYSLDEVPQLINVIKGNMSIVGPRPYYPEELVAQLKKYPDTKDLIKEMQTVKPGITGFWQVSGRNNVDFDKRIEMDAYYARKKSLILDLLILLKTPWAMVSGTGV